MSLDKIDVEEVTGGTIDGVAEGAVEGSWKGIEGCRGALGICQRFQRNFELSGTLN